MIRQKIKLGDLLIKEGIITPEELQIAIEKQQELKSKGIYKRLGEILIDLGFVKEEALLKILSKQLGVEFIDLYTEKMDYEILTSFPVSLLEENLVLPFKEDENFIHIATADPLNYDIFDMIERIVGKTPKIYIALTKDILHIIDNIKKYLKAKELIKKIRQDLNETAVLSSGAIDEFVDFILKDAIEKRCTDIHIEPQKFNFIIRGRIDGVLNELFSFDKDIYFPLVSKIKLLASLDISEKRKPQDGRFSKEYDGKNYDFRISTAPVMYGESVVLRILDQEKILLKMNELGMSEYNLKRFEYLIHLPYGMVYVTGPTGSGKTTTLYAALNELKGPQKKIITVEDPIEYELPLIQQIPVNYKIGLNFAGIIKNILRQDPDIIMIGEVRDSDTLKTSTQAALTGHLVLATLHTNDAISTITRLIQMGAEPYMVAETLLGVLAQRLIRKICPYCKKIYKPEKNEIEKIKKYIQDENITFYKGTGCKMCNFSGYLGREMISEVLIITEEISNLIAEGKERSAIFQLAKANGFISMVDDALLKLKEGVTTIEEILRVVKIDSI